MPWLDETFAVSEKTKPNKHIIQLCSGITHGRGLNLELHVHRFQKLFYVHFFTDCFMKISPQSITEEKS